MNKVVGLLGNIPKNEFSHNAAYAKIWANLLHDVEVETGVPSYDTNGSYLYMGINFSGQLNLFGGLNEDLYNRMEKFLNYEGSCKCLDHEMPDLGEMFRGRLSNKTTYHKFSEEFCDKLSLKCKGIRPIFMKYFVKESLVIGDSHSLSMTPKGVPVFRLDAKTLFGALKDDFIIDILPEGVKFLYLQFGSIDIRHHLLKPNAMKYKALLDKYFQLVKLLQSMGIWVEICGPVPVEYEERKMAKTTMYDGKPFNGSRESRQELTLNFMIYLLAHAPCSVNNYPVDWFRLSGERYAERIMERPRGIHVGFPYYRMNNFGVGYIDKKFEKTFKKKKEYTIF